MSGGACPLVATRIRHGDRYPAAIMIEIGQCVVFHTVIDAGADVEWIAGRAANCERIACSYGCVAGEIDPMNIVAGRRIVAKDGSHARRDYSSTAIFELPGYRGC